MTGQTQGVVTAERAEEFDSVRAAVLDWASGEDAIVAVALVGSWARGAARMDSDADVVVLTASDRCVNEDDWVVPLCGHDAVLVRTVDWGALTERRVRLGSGFEIEFGFAKPSWAGNAPVDQGTRQVVSNGCEVWYDPTDVLGRLLRSLA